jgi:hypothetical protein
MARLIWISDDKKRDAQVEMATAPKPPRPRTVAVDGRAVRSELLVKATEGHTLEALQARHPTGLELARALAVGDPEIDLDNAGRRVGEVDRVWMTRSGRVLYSARFLQVVLDASGAEKSRQEFIDVEATVSEESPLPWSGRLFPIADVVHKFALVRKLQLRHVNGLTFDFLYGLAKTLQDAGKMALIGAGGKGVGPLIFQTNGSPYRGFLGGRVEADAYRLVLHLSNLELKGVPRE